ncbi:hypothetical protein HPB51_022083 [Rhipicephalus microplus]|uniref:Uncharacterized protein n=1 Tax=Rhipicephalus microplus TaxID=6941 RepID=A0A9J6F926_RHIMP|nr:hypothetical protein HPB51_022083 [Rhipicephalus microplus]
MMWIVWPVTGRRGNGSSALRYALEKQTRKRKRERGVRLGQLERDTVRMAAAGRRFGSRYRLTRRPAALRTWELASRFGLRHSTRCPAALRTCCWSAVRVAISLNQASGSLADLVSWLPASGCVTQPGVLQPCGPVELASRSVAAADTGTGSIVCSWPEVLGPEWWHEVAAAHVGDGPLTCSAVAW